MRVCYHALWSEVRQREKNRCSSRGCGYVGNSERSGELSTYPQPVPTFRCISAQHPDYLLTLSYSVVASLASFQSALCLALISRSKPAGLRVRYVSRKR